MCLIGLAVLLLLLVSGTAAEHVRQADRLPGSLAGQFLVASPDMSDPRFAQTVIFIVRHGVSGAMGVVVNRPLGQMAAADLLRDLGIDNSEAQGTIRLHYGGPVEPQSGFVLHTAEVAIEGTYRVDDKLGLTNNIALLKEIAAGRGPRRSLLVMGYAGWAPDQLEGEIARGGWYTAPADEKLIFDTDHASKWRRALARRTIDL